MIEKNLPWAYKIARRIARQYGVKDPDDLKQVAAMAMCNAAKTYDPAKGAFTTYCYMPILRRCLEHVERFRRERPMGVGQPPHRTRIDLIRDTNSDSEDFDAKRFADEEHGFAEVDARLDVATLLDRLTPRQRDVAQRMLSGEDTATIAAGMKISLRRVQQHRDAIRRKWDDYATDV